MPRRLAAVRVGIVIGSAALAVVAACTSFSGGTPSGGAADGGGGERPNDGAPSSPTPTSVPTSKLPVGDGGLCNDDNVLRDNTVLGRKLVLDAGLNNSLVPGFLDAYGYELRKPAEGIRCAFVYVGGSPSDDVIVALYSDMGGPDQLLTQAVVSRARFAVTSDSACSIRSSRSARRSASGSR